jgi:hypothetical protein
MIGGSARDHDKIEPKLPETIGGGKPGLSENEPTLCETDLRSSSSTHLREIRNFYDISKVN